MEPLMFITLSGLAAFSGALGIMALAGRMREAERFGRVDGHAEMSPLIRILKPAMEKLAPLLMSLGNVEVSEQTKGLLMSSGLSRTMNAGEYLVFRLFLTLACALFFVLIAPLGPITSVVTGMFAGWFYSGAWLRARSKGRREKITRALPDAMDLLTLSCEAGLDFAEALQRISMKLRGGPLKEELSACVGDIKTGAARRDALSSMAKRADVAGLTGLVALLVQSDALGVGFGPVLRATADRLRGERLSRAEKKGAVAAQKALFPVAFCIMPVTFIIVFGPLVVRFVTGGVEALL